MILAKVMRQKTEKALKSHFGLSSGQIQNIYL